MNSQNPTISVSERRLTQYSINSKTNTKQKNISESNTQEREEEKQSTIQSNLFN